jgi:hypothetical protein
LQLEAAEKETGAVRASKAGKRATPQEKDLYQQGRDRARKRLERARANAKHPSRQYNFVDVDSRLMRDSSKKNYVQSYNAQLAVDSAAQIIVAAQVTQQVTDRNQLLPMISSIQSNLNATPEVTTADAGYWDKWS